MSDETPDPNEQSSIVNQLILITEFTRRTKAGEQISIGKFVAEHPEHPDELKRHFANVIASEVLKKTGKANLESTQFNSSQTDRLCIR